MGGVVGRRGRAHAVRPRGRGAAGADEYSTADRQTQDVITPRTTRLLRAADLRAFHRAILSCLPEDPIDARGCAVIVPSRSAGEELRRTIENLALQPGAGAATAVRAFPDFVTRDDFYARLRERIEA